jgi:hypothetical protein
MRPDECAEPGPWVPRGSLVAATDTVMPSGVSVSVATPDSWLRDTEFSGTASVAAPAVDIGAKGAPHA